MLKVIFISIILASCQLIIASEKNEGKQVMEVEQVLTPIKIDGKLDEPVWKKAPVYKLKYAANREKCREPISQTGEVQLAWDTNYFYIGIKFNDLDVIAEGEKDQIKHYKFGDICELVLTPEGKTWYWEMYATPAGKKSCFFIPGRARVGLPSMLEYHSKLKVAANFKGTLNDWRDKDVYWTAEFSIPIKELTARGETFGKGSQWRILVARYNYGRYLKTEGAELSTVPQLSVENFHLLNEFAVLNFK